MLKKNHVGRPTNIEKRNKRIKKFMITVTPIAFLAIAVIYITINGIANSMGNSVVEYYCPDSSYKLEGTNCKKTLKEKAIYLGDVNQDEKITNKDYELLSEYVDLVFYDEEDKSNLSDLQIKAADIDENGEVYFVDQTIMREYLDGTISTYGVYSENIGTTRLCDTKYELRGEYCYKEEVINALVKNNKEKVEPKKTFTIHYNANGGVGSISDQEITYGVQTKLNKNTFTKADSNFNGWRVYNNNRKQWACYKNANKTDQGYTNDSYCNSYGYVIYSDNQNVAQIAEPGEYITMYADWSSNYFTVLYNANGGKGTMENQKITYEVQTKLNKNVFTNDKKIFNGWRAYNNNRKQWACYKNASKTDQGYTSDSDCNNYGYVIYSDNQNVTKIAEPGETITMYALWNSVNYFTIKYDANGGTGGMDNQNIIYNNQTKLNVNKFSKSNYYFIGWRVYNNTKNKWICYLNNDKTKQNDADESFCKKYGYAIYSDNQTVAKTAEPGETITMYALWQYSYKNISTSFNGFEKDVKGATVWPMVKINFYKNSNGTGNIGTIPQGTALKAIDMTNKNNESKSYVKVKYNNKEGYINGWLTMINLPDVIPSALYNITNASSSLFISRNHNLSGVTGNDIYGTDWNSNMAPIRIETAKKIQKAQNAALAHGNKIKIYDSFRPWTAQRKVADAVNSNWFTGKIYYITKDFDNKKNTNGYYQTYIGDYKGWFIASATSNPSSHNVAKAIDTTMVFSDDNQEIPTQSKMHELSGNSIPTQSAVDSHKGELALNYLFTNSGFYFLPSEWWHFEDVNNTGYGSYYSQIKCLGNPYSSNKYGCKVNQIKLAK